MSSAGDFMIANGVLVKYVGPGGDVVIPEGVKAIGNGAFDLCRSLTSVTIPEGVTTIGNGAFQWCSSLTSVTIPEGVTTIGNEAFYWCSSLTSVTIPEGVTTIGNEAFYECCSLTSITIPEGVTTIGNEAFYGCRSLASITVPESVTAIGNRPFANCKGLADKNGMIIVSHILFSYIGSDTSVKIPEGVTTIGNGAFQWCSSLTSVTIPEGVTTIGNYAFYECRSLTSITIPEGVTTIGFEAFRLCSSLTSVTIPEKVTAIGGYAFCGCRSLTSITIPEGVVSIGAGAFSECESLTRVAIPKSVTFIGKDAFADCKALAQFSVPCFDGMNAKDIFGGQLPAALNSSIGNLYPLFGDTLLKRHVLEKTIWETLPPDSQAKIYMSRRSKTLAPYYANCVTDPNTLGKNILACLSAEPTSKEYDVVASFMIEFSSKTSPEILQELYHVLKEKKAAAKALKTVEEDHDVMRKLESGGQENATVHPVEAAAQVYCAQVPLDKRAISIAKKGLPYADGSDICSKNALAALLTASSLQFIQCRSSIQGAMGEVELFGNAIAALKIPEAEQIAEGLNRQALTAFLEEQVNSTTYRMYLWAYARFADESSIERITKDVVKKARGNARDRYWAQSMAEALLLSDTMSAMRYFERYGGLEKYAQIRGTTADMLLIQLHDLGFNEKGEKTYDLGGKRIRVSLNADLSLTLYDESTGKTVNTLPKRGADSEKHAAATADIKEMKKNINNMQKSQSAKLFQLFLSGDSLSASAWKKTYLNNPVLERIAAGLVWEQSGKTFTVKGGQPINSAEQPCTIGDAEIVVAHPVEMTTTEITAWQKYFSSHGLKQPFNQVWEPVCKPENITEDRYAGCLIPYYRFLNQEKHGIFVHDKDFHNEIEISLQDCKANIIRIDWRRHDISPKDGFEIERISVTNFTRKANHIIAYLDRVTIYDRIRKDDAGIAKLLSQFTLPQITEFIKVAVENNCTNVTALLLDYKNQNFAGFDPMEEFFLEL